MVKHVVAVSFSPTDTLMQHFAKARHWMWLRRVKQQQGNQSGSLGRGSWPWCKQIWRGSGWPRGGQAAAGGEALDVQVALSEANVSQMRQVFGQKGWGRPRGRDTDKNFHREGTIGDISRPWKCERENVGGNRLERCVTIRWGIENDACSVLVSSTMRKKQVLFKLVLIKWFLPRNKTPYFSSFQCFELQYTK